MKKTRINIPLGANKELNMQGGFMIWLGNHPQGIYINIYKHNNEYKAKHGELAQIASNRVHQQLMSIRLKWKGISDQ
jgi:hypothetical protein